MSQERNAILAINSLDRYQSGRPGEQPAITALFSKFLNRRPFPNNFQIGSAGALIYGYMNKLVVSQVQLQYNVPTVIPGRNDTFYIYGAQIDTPANSVKVQITIPYGYYTPIQLAAVLQTLIRASDVATYAPTFRVVYNSAAEIPSANSRQNENTFTFSSNNQNFGFFFPSPGLLIAPGPTGQNLNNEQTLNAMKAYLLMGIDYTNSELTQQPGSPFVQQTGGNNINFLYTPYVDIISETLTKYQNIKDTDTSSNKVNSIVARVYLSGVGVPQETGGVVGSKPFTVVQDMNSPKVMRWSRDEAVNSIDFQLRDQYGDLLFFQDTTVEESLINISYYTEFQMTLMCIESERY
jgi:hypothetical protein